MTEMNAQFRVLEETKLWNFIKQKVKEEYGIEIVILRFKNL